MAKSQEEAGSKMSEEMNLVYLQGIQLQARIELEGMIAENQQRIHLGQSLAYVEKDFQELRNRHGIHHNALMGHIYGS